MVILATTSQSIDPTTAAAATAAFMTIFMILAIGAVLQLITWVGMWTMASKAGHFGLWSCIPIVQGFIWSLMAGKPAWWGLLWLIPVVNVIIMAITLHNISVRFGRGLGTTLGLIFLPFIFWPILGLGSAQYNANAT